MCPCSIKKDLDGAKHQRYEKSINDITATISSMANPFSTDETELVSITSSIEVETNVANGILGAQETGEQQFAEFCKNNLLCEKPDIFQKLKKNKLSLTFPDTISSK